MSDLENILKENIAPMARTGLAARILRAAETAEPANDFQFKRPWWSLAGIAAMAVMAALFVIQPSGHTDIEWSQIADASGFLDLYEWVEGDES